MCPWRGSPKFFGPSEIHVVEAGVYSLNTAYRIKYDILKNDFYHFPFHTLYVRYCASQFIVCNQTRADDIGSTSGIFCDV